MASRRYTITVEDCTSGVVRRATLPVGLAITTICLVVTVPVLIGLGAAWKTRADVSALVASQQTLELENTSYREATKELAGQITSLESVIAEIGSQSALDPKLSHAMDKLPAVVKSRAMGGSSVIDRTAQTALTSLTGPEDTFGLLRTLLEGLESRLSVVRGFVERRNALAAATPSIWPSRGWLTSTVGPRRDPMTGDEDFHTGLDIAGERGQPVYATASGHVTHAGYQGAYGNMVVIDHGFGLETRYGHLLDCTVKPGSSVTRGDIVGHVGATGRATGYHLHYEVLANGKLLNPLQLLTQNPRDR
jgi:murein DD-endopeptidase MepM/ murein hydrolase activator NlpD